MRPYSVPAYTQQPSAQQAERKDCQHGYADICAAGARDGVACPVDSCDIDDGKMTPQLRDVLARANSIAGGDDDGAQVKGLTVIHTTTGKPYTYAGAQTAWKRAIARAREAYEKECVEAGVQPVAGFLQNMHFHDLRRKSLTDAKAQGKDPQKLGGHTDPKMTARYLEQVEIVWGGEWFGTKQKTV
ncbi:hypothetical protein N6G06_15675 [Cupriavidus gilardii]|uniref:hypothetical protein n=1 Tax=Cupriavidus gilardii TaxID=82541 RepID=UPI0021C22557|nr:hypothetical protein [Cupriavidus gilardii]MCT9072799.1 hypothetical protein [Cupriavidus gilardii]